MTRRNKKYRAKAKSGDTGESGDSEEHGAQAEAKEMAMGRTAPQAEKNTGKKPAANDAAEQLVLEITNSIAQRSVAARRRRSSAARESTPAPQVKPAAPPANAPAAEKVEAPAEPVAPAAPVVEAKPEIPAAPEPVKAEPESVKAEPVHAAPEAPVIREELKAAPIESQRVETPAPVQTPYVPVEQPAAKKADPLLETGKGRASRSTPAKAAEPNTLCVFCYEEAETPIGNYVVNTANYLSGNGTRVHVFSRKPFAGVDGGVRIHVVGEDTTDDLIERVRSFARRATDAFRSEFSDVSPDTVLMGHEWASIPIISDLESYGLRSIFSVHSLETQRSDMKSALSQEIQRMEAKGLRAATTVLIQQDAAAAHAVGMVPECGTRLVYARHPFTTRPIVPDLDPGTIKARYNVGPIDPTVLFIGDLDDRHGPDVLMKAVPQILKNNKQARFIFVGDGHLQWPLRVHARYCLLEHAVRIAGHVGGDALLDLIQAADVIAVPSRVQTEEWPILAAWAAKRPVLTTQSMIGSLLEHEINSVVAYANENSMVWGVERLLFDEGLRKKTGENGHATLEKRFGHNCAAEQLASMIAVAAK